MKKYSIIKLIVLSTISIFFIVSCSKQTVNPSSLYTPTAKDTTATASLLDLQQGRTLYISNCNSCHDLYAPEAYSASQWRSIMNNMAPNTNMNSTEVSKVTKYVTKGK